MDGLITVRWRMESEGGRLYVDPSDFQGMSAEDIKGALQDQVDEEATANACGYCENVEDVVQSILDRLALDRLAKSEASS